MHSEPERGRRKITAKAGAVIVFIFAVLWFFRASILTAAGELITADESTNIQNGDPAVLLMGDRSGERAESALKFLSTYPESRIMVGKEEPTPMVEAGRFPHSHDVHRKMLVEFGIDPERIITPECINTSTLDEARCAKAWLTSLEEKPGAIVVITSWYHSGRAAWIFGKVFADTGIAVKSYSFIRPGSSPDGWWKKESSFLDVFNEYLKRTYWFLNQREIEKK